MLVRILLLNTVEPRAPIVDLASEIGTLYLINVSTKDMYVLFEVPKITCPIVLVHLEPLKENNLSIKDKTAEFILSPTCPLFGDSTVHNKI